MKSFGYFGLSVGEITDRSDLAHKHVAGYLRWWESWIVDKSKPRKLCNTIIEHGRAILASHWTHDSVRSLVSIHLKDS